MGQSPPSTILLSEKKSINFAIRGLKGWAWTPEQYLEEIPQLGAMKLNFLMNCYLSMRDIEHYSLNDGRVNQWWKPLPIEKKLAYEKVVRACWANNIEFCFSMNPSSVSERHADSNVPEDVEALWQHYSWMQSLGVQWFNISLDDIGERGSDPTMQARLVNELLQRLRRQDKNVKMTFCSSWYWGDGNDSGRNYLRVLSKELDPDVYVFWTGDQAITPRITRKAAESYKAVIGHRLIIWDNYPCNDEAPTMHLGPLTGRDPDLCEVADGYMSNSMHKQNRINRLPLATCADYAYDPYHYNPDKSIERAIVNRVNNSFQAELLRGLSDLYPSNLTRNQSHLYNPVRERLIKDLKDGWSVRDVSWYPEWIETIAFELASVFNSYYMAEFFTIKADADWIKGVLNNKIKLE